MPSFDANTAIEAAKERAREANKPSARLKTTIEELENILVDIEDDSVVMDMTYYIYYLNKIAESLEEKEELKASNPPSTITCTQEAFDDYFRGINFPPGIQAFIVNDDGEEVVDILYLDSDFQWIKK